MMKRYLSIALLISALSSATAQPDSLNSYLQIAAENNPEVRAAFLRYEAALQKPAQMGAYDDPQLEMGFFLEPMDIVGGREIAQFQLMQMFPWFGTKKAARTEAQHMAQMAFEEFREARDNLFLEIHTQWYLLCSLKQKQINTEANKQLLQQLETLALHKFASGGSVSGETGKGKMEKGKTEAGVGTASAPAMNMGNMKSPGNQGTMESGNDMSGMTMPNASASGMSEVLRIQLEIVEAESNSKSLASEIAAAKAQFNALLNRAPETEVLIPDEFPQLIYLFDIKAIIQTIKEQNPMLGMLREEALAYKARGEMERKMGYPMFGIGLQYMLIAETMDNAAGMETSSHGATAATPPNAMNGKDMIMPMLSVSIPIFRSKYKAAQKESQLLRQAAEETLFNTQNTLEAALYQFKHQLDDAQRKIDLYRKQREIARTTCELITAEFAAGKSDLSAVIQVDRQLLDYQLKEAEAIAAYNTAVANLQKLTAQQTPF